MPRGWSSSVVLPASTPAVILSVACFLLLLVATSSETASPASSVQQTNLSKSKLAPTPQSDDKEPLWRTSTSLKHMLNSNVISVPSLHRKQQQQTRRKRRRSSSSSRRRTTFVRDAGDIREGVFAGGRQKRDRTRREIVSLRHRNRFFFHDMTSPSVAAAVVEEDREKKAVAAAEAQRQLAAEQAKANVTGAAGESVETANVTEREKLWNEKEEVTERTTTSLPPRLSSRSARDSISKSADGDRIDDALGVSTAEDRDDGFSQFCHHYFLHAK
jgi:hypothetical protein